MSRMLSAGFKHSMWWFSDAGLAFTFGVLTYPSTQWYRYSILIHSKVCMRQWDWHKNRNRSLLRKKKQSETQISMCNVHKQITTPTEKKKTNINAAPIKAVVPWQFCFSTVANTFIINVIVDAVIVRATRCCIFASTLHKHDTIDSLPYVPILFGLCVKFSVDIMHWWLKYFSNDALQIWLFSHLSRQDKCGAS